MSLIELWKTAPDQLREKRVEQVISFAGDGRLGDNNTAPTEFRAFLAGIPSSMLNRYVTECLSDSFKDSGFALQDLVNEIGHRLGFDVTAGRYRGIRGEIGHDGLWTVRNGPKIIVEVKTTDAYRINLETVATYRKKLIREGIADEDSASILIVVGRQDTSDFEAQIRGSKHAWDIRLISTESLLRLLTIKEEVEDPGIEKRIREILIPHEYTRVDGIIDLVFSTTEEIRQEEEDLSDDEELSTDTQAVVKDKPMGFNDACVQRIEASLGVSLVKRSRVIYQSPDEKTGLVCKVSKEYFDARGKGYWFAFHPHQKEFLENLEQGFAGFGCGSSDRVILFPIKDITLLLDGMNQTPIDDARVYWHVKIYQEGDRWVLHRRKGEDWPDITQYFLQN